jgi:hypothetical protein
MTGNAYLKNIPATRTPFSRHRDALLLATLLTAGLVVIAPLLFALSEIPLIVWVVAVGLGYGVVVLAVRRIVTGSYVALAVTMTFAANVPLASREYLQGLPGTLGPNIWLVHLPLVAVTSIVGYQYLKGEWTGITVSGYLFGGFVLWTVVSAIGGIPIRQDTALYFTAFAFQGWVVFVVIIHSVRRGDFELDTLLSTLLIAVVGHALIGIGQFVNQRPFGLSYLGEADRQVAGVSYPAISMGPLEAELGPHISGLAGMSFILASLILLVAPVLLATAMRNEGWGRGLPLLGFGITAVVLRFTISDGARGGLFLALLAFVALYGINNSNQFRENIQSLPVTIRRGISRRTRAPAVLETLFVIVVALFGVFYPSTKAGAVSEPIEKPPSDSDPGGMSGSKNGSNGQSGVAEDVVIPDWVDNLSVPLFDLSHLGVRLKQYVVALDILPHHLLFGIGGGNFQYVAANTLGRPMPLHNIYLAILVETGVPGFVLYMATVVSIFWVGWRLIRSGESRILVIGVLSGMVGYLGFGMWDHLMIDRVVSFIPFWTLAGGIVGEYYRTRNEIQ